MERKLVTVREVTEVLTHPNADALDLVYVDGWQVVAKRGDFKVGDLAVYFEVDSVLPAGDGRWEFLLKRGAKVFPNGVTGHRLRTIKLRGEFSQGLILPINQFTVGELSSEDLTAALGVFKYEQPVSSALAGNARGEYPYWIPKTDQERIENCWRNVEKLADLDWVVEEKLEGSSVTIYSDHGVLGITSRNVDFKLDDPENQENTFVKTAKAQYLDLVTQIPGRWAIRGELIGNVQGNIYKLNDFRIHIFDVWDGEAQSYLNLQDRDAFIRKLEALGAVCHVVPVINVCFRLTSQKDIIERATGKSELFDTLREGIVLKTADYIKQGTRKEVVSFKAISREYLAKEKD